MGRTKRKDRRTKTRSVPRDAPLVHDPIAMLPTPERMARAGVDFEVGGDERSGKVLRLTDIPLERMKARGALNDTEYSALQKYRDHWYLGGLLPVVGSIDLNRIFASDPLSLSGMAKSESQAHHRQQYRQANEELGMRTVTTVDRVVCHEWTLEAAGYELGWNAKAQAIAAATELLRYAGDKLARLWGMDVRR